MANVTVYNMEAVSYTHLDVYKRQTLMSDVQRIVMEKFGVKLEPEVKFLGEF